MPQERKTIGFTPAEVKQINNMLEEESKPKVLEGVNTFSDAIRRLTKIGLRQVAKSALVERYRAAAAEAKSFYTPARIASANRSAMRARHAMGISSSHTAGARRTSRST